MTVRRPELLAGAALLCAALALFVMLQSNAWAAGASVGLAAPQVTIPSTFNYQGILRNPDGSLVNGSSTMTVRIYDLASGGATLYTEAFTAVPVRDGLFNVVLGDSTPLPATLFAANAPLFIGVSLAANPELIPRQRVHPVPWALMATTLVSGATVQGLTVAGASTVNGPSTFNGSAVFSGAAVFLSGTTFSGGTNLNGATNLNGTTSILSRLFVSNASAVGIGTTNPIPLGSPGGGPQLHVVANVAKTTAATTRAFALTTNEPLGATGGSTNPFGLDIRLTGAPLLANRAVYIQSTDWNTAGGGNIVLQPEGGNVGIGTSTPTKGKLHVTGTLPTVAYNIGGFLNRDGAGDVSNTNVNRSVSIWGDSFVVAGEFNAVSDARIKTIQGRSDGSADLATLRRIEITDYTLKDVIANGSAPHKKVIGQQVEQVFPQAVNQHTNVVPDIYQRAEVKDGWVRLATTLKKGERVRLIGDTQEGIYDVLEVEQDRFRTDYAAAGDGVFVYGREVKDFRVVDYEAIAMLNVSATQELNRRVEQQAVEIKTLKAENEALNARLTALEQKISALAR